MSKLRKEFNNFEELSTYNQDEMIPTTFLTVGENTIIEDLTPEEYGLFLGKNGTPNRLKLIYFGLISYTSIEEAKRLFPGQPGGNTPRNAFQHAYWSAALTITFGSEFAEKLTTAHERQAGSVRDDQFMDLYNNEVGRSIAEAYPLATYERLSKLVLDALRNGELVVLDNHNIYFSDQCPQFCDYP